MKHIIMAMIAAFAAHKATAESDFNQKYKFELREISTSVPLVVERFEVRARAEKPAFFSYGTVNYFSGNGDSNENPIAEQRASSGLSATIVPTSHNLGDLKLINLKLKYSRLVSLKTRNFGNFSLPLPVISGFDIDGTYPVAQGKPTLVTKFSDESGSYEMWITTSQAN